jgi:hypothetical protein
MTTSFARSALAAAALSLLSLAPLRAQGTGSGGGTGSTPIGSQAPAAKPAQAAPAAPPLDFSGVIFGKYETRTDSSARAGAGGDRPSQFTVDRVYLTFRMPVGDRMSIRATTDIVQQANGWGVRLKYGYLQANLLENIAGRKGLNALARVGMLHTVMIEHEESFWPRYLGPVAAERFGFFSSSDLGVATQVSLPAKLGEVYATVTNGPGYATPENDRFKDVAARLTITPFGGQPGWLSTFAISPWVYRGATASRFVNGGAGQAGPIPDAMARNRWGIVAGLRDPRLTLAAHYARRTEDVESGANTLASPRGVASSTGELWSVHGVARPFSWAWGKNTARLGLVGRLDHFSTVAGQEGSVRQVIAGIQLEPTSRTALALDYQELAPRDFAGGGAAAGTTRSSGWYLHWSASF